jgi:uncharacterized FlaG/YvyC family protein
MNEEHYLSRTEQTRVRQATPPGGDEALSTRLSAQHIKQASAAATVSLSTHNTRKESQQSSRPSLQTLSRQLNPL